MAIKDTYFFDYNAAYLEAKKKHKFGSFDNLQICYYNGLKTNKINYPNLISVPIGEMFEYFCETPNRMFQSVDFDGKFEPNEQIEVLEQMKRLLELTVNYKKNIEKAYKEEIKKIKLNFNEPLRIFFITTRLTTVLQYSAKNLAESFRDAGYEVFVSVEDNAMQSWGQNQDSGYFGWHLKNMLEFKPHICVNVDYMHNDFLPDEMFNFIWFQDPVPEITNNNKLHLRSRDFVFSLIHDFDFALINNGVSKEKIYRQVVCTNERIFNDKYNYKRQNKVVFVGSSYSELAKDKKEKELVDHIIDLCNIGKDVNFRLLGDVFGIDFEHIKTWLYPAAIRQLVVGWICKQKIIEVEIYGDGWDKIDETRYCFKGSLSYGKEVAKVYNKTKYGLVVHPYQYYQQRLFEISACGAIPLIYKDSLNQEEFTHNNSALLFGSYDELLSLLGKQTIESPIEIAKDNSYGRMTQKILQIVSRELEKNEN